MRDELIIIDSLMNEHEAMDGHMQSVCGLLESWDAEELAELEPSDLDEAFMNKTLNLKQTMINLEEGLKIHQKREEELLLPIAGAQVIEALNIEHREMVKQIGEINYVLREYNLGALASNVDYLKLIVNNLCNLVNSHSVMEDGLFNLLKKRYI
jgi:hemerythrin